MIRNRRLAVTRSARAIRQFFASKAGKKAIGWAVLLLAMLLSVNGLNVVNSYVNRDFMTAISDRRMEHYTLYAAMYVGVFALSALVAAFSRFAEERLRLLWRGWTTRELIDQYLGGRNYYRLQGKQGVDNPDQRITDDVKAFTQTTLSIFILSLSATITSVAFIGVLWSITPLLVLAAVIHAAIGTSLTIILGRPLVDLNNRQLSKEADLRYQLIQVREASEPVAILNAEEAVRGRLRDRLGKVIVNTKKIIAVTRNTILFTGMYNYMIQVVPILIVAPFYLRKQIEFGVITQSMLAYAQVMGAFSLIVTQFEVLSSFAAVADRLNAIYEAIESAARPRPKSVAVASDGDRVAFEAVTLRAPTEDRVLVRELSLDVPAGRRLMVSGPNGAAKDALFRAAAGLWDDGDGRIVLPPRGQSVLVPRHTFTIPGTLREQLLVALPGTKVDDDRLHAALHDSGLEMMLERVGGLDGVQDWPKALSTHEQHLLDVARVRLAGPKFVFLDQVADAVGADQAGALYKWLAESSITVISSGDNHGVIEYHDTVLEVCDDGTWTVTPARDAAAASAWARDTPRSEDPDGLFS